MARPRNRKAPAARGAAGRGASPASAPRRGRAPANRRDDGRPRRPERTLDPAERKLRNRWVAFLGVLVAINAWVFLGRRVSFGDARDQAVAAVGGAQALPPHASPPADACTGHEVRIFHGLDELLQVDASLSNGRTLRLALLELGVAGPTIDELEAALRPRVDLSLIGGTGAPLRVALDREGGVHALEIELAEGRMLQACRSPTGVQVRNLEHPMRSDVVVVGLLLGRHGDLRQAVIDAGEDPSLAAAIAEALAYDVDFLTEARPDDRVQVMVEKRWLGRHFHRYGPVLAVRYLGAAGRIAYFRYKPVGGALEFYDGEGVPMRRALRRSPVAFHPVKALARNLLPPELESVGGRGGAVYRLAEGAPLVALADGVVRRIGRDEELGLVVEIAHDDGLVARYAHVGAVFGALQAGQRVRASQLVAVAGHSGRTPHDRLRLELWREQGGPEDPFVLTAKGDARPAVLGAPLEGEALARFREDVRAWGLALRKAG